VERDNIFYSICGNFLKRKLKSFLAANSTLDLQNRLLPNSSLQFLQQADDKAIFCKALVILKYFKLRVMNPPKSVNSN